MSIRTTMSHAQLILSGNQQKRLQIADKIIRDLLNISVRSMEHPDLLIFEADESLGIEQIRQLKKQLSLKPYLAQIKIALIPQAEKMTVPAQNAILKTLEEPPANSALILLAPKKENLLPTIVSRCQIIQLSQNSEIIIEEKENHQISTFLFQILKSRAGERINLTEKFSQRLQALNLINKLLIIWRELLLIKSGVKINHQGKKIASLRLSQIIKAAQETEKSRQMIKANINPRLIIENLFLSYPYLKE